MVDSKPRCHQWQQRWHHNKSRFSVSRTIFWPFTSDRVPTGSKCWALLFETPIYINIGWSTKTPVRGQINGNLSFYHLSLKFHHFHAYFIKAEYFTKSHMMVINWLVSLEIDFMVVDILRKSYQMFSYLLSIGMNERVTCYRFWRTFELKYPSGF